jgi:hypothetical protein
LEPHHSFVYFKVIAVYFGKKVFNTYIHSMGGIPEFFIIKSDDICSKH